MDHFILDNQTLSLDEIAHLLSSGKQLVLSPEALERIANCRKYLDETIQNRVEPVYGINTGFGALCNVKIEHSDLAQLQHNLVVSHACGSGEAIPTRVIKTMLLLKIMALSKGHSGVRAETILRLIDFYNNDVLPVVFEFGSLGASGDLAPLAHLSLPLIGMGDVYVNGVKTSASHAHEVFGWEPLSLASKEGLALLNGTQFMSAYGVELITQGRRILNWAQAIAALSLEAYDGRIEPFHEKLQAIRPHHGQIQVAANMRNILNGSGIATQAKAHVQDPYSFRCIPQVLGASLDVIHHVEQVFATEVNAVTDNPNIFPDEDLILSGGNFHGQTLAMALDYLCLALHEIGSFSERRTYQLVSGKRGLPPFLAGNAGLHSGLMITQYSAASLVSRNKQLCTPASADTIDSSAGQEDHVSMGANAATKAMMVLQNLEQILAIELITAAQAIEFRRPHETSAYLETLIGAYRQKVPYQDGDRFMHPEMKLALSFMRSHQLPEPI